MKKVDIIKVLVDNGVDEKGLKNKTNAELLTMGEELLIDVEATLKHEELVEEAKNDTTLNAITYTGNGTYRIETYIFKPEITLEVPKAIYKQLIKLSYFK